LALEKLRLAIHRLWGAFMTDCWQQIERICQSALELGESRRRAFLDEACGGGEELRREVESLLGASASYCW
jgi:hypothetical protein